MKLTEEEYGYLLLSWYEIRSQAQHFSVKVKDRTLLDIIRDIILEKVKEG